MITPINFKNIYPNQAYSNQQQKRQITNNLTPLQKDSVCFCGAAKILSDMGDRAFVNIITKTLDLDEKSASKLKNTVWKFLRENKASSLGDLGGEEHFDEQVELQGRITKALSISENDNEANEYIADEIIKRCDSGKDYIPQGASGHERSKLLENILSGNGNISIRAGLNKFFNDTADDDFYIFAKKMLRQTPEESHELRKTIDGFLEENNYKSIQELFSDEDAIGDQAALIEKLENEFNLSETESTALHFAFLDRANINVIGNFTTDVSLYVKDFDSILKIVKDCGLKDHQIDGWNLDQLLYREMTAEAKERNFDNVFELFKPENNFAKSKTYKFIKEKSGLSEEQQTNLIIDFIKASKNPEALAESLPKHEAKDNFYANIQIDMIVGKIAKTFDIGNPEAEIFEDVISEGLQSSVRKIYPEHITGGENCKIKQVAFEIAEKYHLPAGAEKTIEKIIKEVQDGGTKTADVYVFEKLKSDFGIE